MEEITCPIKRGVIQGGIISPKLFNIFYDSLIDRLDKLGIFIMAYADDIVIGIIGITLIKKVIKVINN